MDREEILKEAAQELKNSRQKPFRDKIFKDFFEESGCDKLNSASTASVTIDAVNKFSLATATAKGMRLVGLREDLKARLKINSVPGQVSILREAFKEEEKSGKKNDDLPPNLIPPKPWNTKVKGEDLLEEISSTIARFIFMPENLADTIALYIGSSYFLAVYDVFPFLHITSPVKGCGKSKLLEVIAELVPLGQLVVDPSTASLFRSVHLYQISACFDEIDRVFKNHEDIMDFLVSSYRRKDAEGFMRCNEKGEIQFFSAWGVKVLAGIGELKQDTLKDRTIRAQVQKKTKDEKTERLRTRFLERIALPIRQRLMRFAADNIEEMEKVMDVGPGMPTEFEGFDRPAENWEPLIAFGDLCSKDWGERARGLALESLGEKAEEDGNYREELLIDIKGIFKDNPCGIHSNDLAVALNKIEDRSWGGWNEGAGMKVRDVSKILKSFNIKSKNLSINSVQRKGYKPEFFAEVFERYTSDLDGEVDGRTDGTEVDGPRIKDPSGDNPNNINREEGGWTGNNQNQEDTPLKDDPDNDYDEVPF